MTSKSEQAAELRRKAEEIEQEEHLAERMKDAGTIPTCPKCGGRTFIVNTYTTVAQSIIYGDEEGEEEWGDDYESGDHTDVNESAMCSECGADAQEVLEAHDWTFYDEPRPTGEQADLETKAARYDAIVKLLVNEHGTWRTEVNGGDLVQDVSLIIDPDNRIV